VECDWLPSQTDLKSGFMISRILMNLVEECLYFSDSSSLEGLSLDFSDSSSLEELSSAFSDSSSLVDLPLISAPSLSLGCASVGCLEDSSSEVNRVGFGLSLLFFADGVTLLFFEPFFDADYSCRLLLEDALAGFCLLFLTLYPLSERILMDFRNWFCLASTSGTLVRSSACMAKCPR
jgi:hypothetical protein